MIIHARGIWCLCKRSAKQRLRPGNSQKDVSARGYISVQHFLRAGHIPSLTSCISFDYNTKNTAMPSFTVYKGSQDGSIKQSTTTKPDELTGDNVLVRVTASGLCGTGQ